MRHLQLMALTSLLGTGCTGNCPPPQQLNGQKYKVFANQVELLKAPKLDTFTAPPDFVSYTSPINGDSVWVIDWGQSDMGPVTVSIDGQALTGTGDWDPVECGHFDLDISGDYVSDDGTLHAIRSFGSFVQYEDLLEGEVEWVESWATEDGESGVYRVIAAIRGHL